MLLNFLPLHNKGHLFPSPVLFLKSSLRLLPIYWAKQSQAYSGSRERERGGLERNKARSRYRRANEMEVLLQPPLDNTVCHVIYNNFSACGQVGFITRYKKPTRRLYHRIKLVMSTPNWVQKLHDWVVPPESSKNDAYCKIGLLRWRQRRNTERKW